MIRNLSVVAFLVASFIHLAWTVPSLAQTPYYQGKTITIIEGREPGGTGAMRVASIVPFLRKYIPGEPTIVSQFMPGGGGRKAANYIYRNARPDGLTIGNVGVGLVANAVLGQTGVEYELEKLKFLGSPNRGTHYVFLSVGKLGLDSLEKLRAHSGLRIGAQTVGHDIYINGRLFAWLMDLKSPKFITGYSGTELDVALVQGELDARANIADTILTRNAEFVQKRIMNFHAIMEIPRGDQHHHFKNLPEIESFARSEMEKKVLSLHRTFRLGGSPYIMPPGTPNELVEIIRDAMRKAFKDPEFHKEFKKLVGDDPSPLMPEDQERSIRELPRDRQTIELFNRIAGSEALPPR